MKRSTGLTILVVVVIIGAAFAFYKFVIEPSISAPELASNPSDNPVGSCPVCSEELIERRIDELVPTVPKGLKARTGRAANNSGACRRVRCVDFTTICETKDKKAAKRFEAFANRTMKTKHPEVCGNDAPDARGNQTKQNVAESIYFKVYDENQPGSATQVS